MKTQREQKKRRKENREWDEKERENTDRKMKTQREQKKRG